jgi:hypothetical protein
MTNQEFCQYLATRFVSRGDDSEEVSYEAIQPRQVGKKGISYFLVGRNSDNQFYLGTDANNNLWKCSIDYWDGPCEKEVTQNNIGYIGHF